MKKTLQIWGSLVLFLFLFPVIITYLPHAEPANSPKLVKEPLQIVYAANIIEEVEPEIEIEPKLELVQELKKDKGNVLLYFTHSHEAYQPITKAKEGKVAVSHNSENIMKFGEKLKNQLGVNGIDTDILPIAVPHANAYKTMRPHIEKQIQQKKYDLIVDLHRDSIGPEKTTIVHNNEKYAKVAFVIGMEHPNFEKNRANAVLLKNEMELLVPGITRNLVMKHGAGVDGKYNQDLSPYVVLIELGGIGNSEDQLNRTVTVIAEATSEIIHKLTINE
ncbi:stage II sporulation protein P [Sporosarcina siberiensis]|uniref:Stage II sporulation protein P n=1 Tax=Sporosarcina siberiensis TaxID=1365606 RepID=A0ABW4SD71_9BACL